MTDQKDMSLYSLSMHSPTDLIYKIAFYRLWFTLCDFVTFIDP